MNEKLTLMDSVLFFGHGKTEMRGGPTIFMSIYKQWPDREKHIIYEKSYLQSLKKLIAFLKIKKTSTLILENEYFTEVFLALLLKVLNRKLNVYGPAYHLPSSPEAGKEFINSVIHYFDYKIGLWFMAFLYSGIYTENSYMKNYIESLNRDQRIIVESPGIKKENIIPLDRVKNLKRDIDLLYLTSMTKNKGIFDFLAVVKEMQKEQNDIRIAIAGYASPEVLDYISTFATSNNIPHIELYSNIPENEKYKLYSRSKIYVLPSIEDGIPITFYEAWSYGVIVIGYNLETYTDIKNYFIPVEKGNAKELTDKCRNIYKNYSDNFNSLMEKAYRYSMNHSYEAGINNIIQGILKINEMINRDR